MTHDQPVCRFFPKKMAQIEGIVRQAIGPIRLTPYSAYSTCFFSYNSIFLSQQFSQNSVFQSVTSCSFFMVGLDWIV